MEMAHAVVGREGFDFGGAAFGVAVEWRDDGDVAVGEDAVDVVEQDFDAAGAVFGGNGGHASMVVQRNHQGRRRDGSGRSGRTIPSAFGWSGCGPR